MYCTKCGTKLPDGAQFCPKCGTVQKQQYSKGHKEEQAHKELEVVVSAAQQGNRSAMEELIRRSQSVVYYNCLKLLGNEATAQDTTQEVFISVFQKLNTLKNPKAYIAWVQRIALNKCKDRLAATDPLIFVDEYYEDSDNDSELLVSDDNAVPDKALDNDETRHMIRELIDQLPAEQHICVLMYYYDGMSVREIAGVLGVSENTVKSRLNYARNKLKAGIEGYERDGIKLYSAAPMAVLSCLRYFLRQDAEASVSSQSAQRIIQTALPATNVSSSAASKVSESAVRVSAHSGKAVRDVAGAAATGQSAKTVVGAAAKAAGSHIAGKIIAAILAVAVLGGGGALLYNSGILDRWLEPESTVAVEPIESAESEDIAEPANESENENDVEEVVADEIGETEPSVDIGAVYSYLELVQNKQSTLDVPYSSWDIYAPEKRRQTIMLLDIWGDDLPELILAECLDVNNVYNPLEPLSIYTYQEGQIVKLCEETITCNYQEANFVYYYVLQTSVEKNLYIMVSEGHEAGSETWYRFPSDGEMQLDMVAQDIFIPGYVMGLGDDESVDTYYDGNGNEITEEEYKAWKEPFDASVETVIFCGDLRWYSDPVSMTYDEAIAYLTEQVNSTDTHAPIDDDAEEEVTPAPVPQVENVDVSSLPDNLTEFLDQFQGFYFASAGTLEYNYQTAANDGTNILAEILGSWDASCVWYPLYPGEGTTEHWDGAYDDFFNGASTYYYSWYETFDGAQADWIAKNIFNLTEDSIETLAQKGQDEGLFLIVNDGSDHHYIVPKEGVGDPFCKVVVTEAETDGEKYYVIYNIYDVTDYTDESTYTYRDTYYAVMELKEIDGNEYWSMYSNSSDGFPTNNGADEIIGETLAAYKDFLAEVHHEDEWIYDIEAFWLCDINNDSVPELFTHGGGQMDYNKMFTYRNGTVDLVWWGTSFDAYRDNLFGVGFSADDGCYLYTLYEVTRDYELRVMFRYAEWMYDGTYSIGETAQETDERVSYDVVQAGLAEYIDDESIYEMYFRENTAANREEYLQIGKYAGSTVAPFSITPEELEQEIEFIRSCYYEPSDLDRKITVDNGTDGWNYSREYTFHDGKLVFAFIYDGTEEHRLYFKDDNMIRYIDEYHTTYDFGALGLFDDWANRALQEAYALV